MAAPLSADALTREVAALLGALPDTLPALSPLPTLPAPDALPGLIDHTLLAPHSTPADIERVSAEGAALKAATVCVNSSMVPFAAAALRGHATRPIATIGFPFGAGGSAAKALEARTAVEQGAAEIDMVSWPRAVRSHTYSTL
jgi:deoxyribose-phosphate aldolase